jgi:hypothetical protein
LSFAAKNWLVNANPLRTRHNMSLGRRPKERARQFDLNLNRVFVARVRGVDDVGPAFPSPHLIKTND